MTAIEAQRRESHIFPRADSDWYQEPGWCSERLFAVEPFVGEIIDPACGAGRIVEAARARGHCAHGSDITARGYGEIGDFFDSSALVANIISNPPYSIFRQFAEHALRLARHKVCLIFPLARLVAARWLQETPLARIYLLSPRPSMPPGEWILRGNKPGGGRVDFSWLVWSQGFNGRPELRWLHRDGGDRDSS